MSNLNTACGFNYLLQPLIESALLKMWLKVERSSLQFMNINLLRTIKMKRKLNFLRLSPFNHYLAGLYLSYGGWIKDPLRKTYFGILSSNLVLKFNLSTNFFLQVERTFLACHVHQKLAFSGHLIAYAWIQNILK